MIIDKQSFCFIVKFSQKCYNSLKVFIRGGETYGEKEQEKEVSSSLSIKCVILYYLSYVLRSRVKAWDGTNPTRC